MRLKSALRCLQKLILNRECLGQAQFYLSEMVDSLDRQVGDESALIWFRCVNRLPLEQPSAGPPAGRLNGRYPPIIIGYQSVVSDTPPSGPPAANDSQSTRRELFVAALIQYSPHQTQCVCMWYAVWCMCVVCVCVCHSVPPG